MNTVEAATGPALLSLEDSSGIASFNGMLEELESFDLRSERKLEEAAFDDGDAMERERAIWELAVRKKRPALGCIERMYRAEPDRSLRWNLLWLAVKTAGSDAWPLLDLALKDGDHEVRDWARLFLAELAGSTWASQYATGRFTAAGAFDQTLPLQIAGFAVVEIPGGPRLRATLSPLWFNYVMGRVLACTNLDTIMRDLVVEKCLSGYNPDGSDHYEIFKFAGVSWPTRDGHVQHRYESLSTRPFYSSGRVKDKSAAVLQDVPVILNRAADTGGNLLAVEQTTSAIPDAVADNGRGARLDGGTLVHSVRGQFFGWAATSLSHFGDAGRILPGTVQLASPVHESTAELTNTYLCGTFRGKIGDLDGDGFADVNLIPCHGTVDGRLDLNLNGRCDRDVYA